jgi:uncharacterized protein (TIGR02466 family)
MTLHNLFIQPIACFKLKQNLKNLYSFSISLKNSRVRTNVGGFQSNDLDFLNEKELQPFIKDLIKNTKKFCKIFSFKDDLEPFIDNLWVNINGYKDFNQTHYHPNSIISGAYYINVPENSGNIVFHNSAFDLMYPLNYFKINSFNQYNSSTWWVKPKNNLLILFPSWFKHHVEPNLSNEKRISISFNIYLRQNPR